MSSTVHQSYTSLLASVTARQAVATCGAASLVGLLPGAVVLVSLRLASALSLSNTRVKKQGTTRDSDHETASL